VPEHVVLIDQYASKYPYSQDGQLPAPTDAADSRPVSGLDVHGFRDLENSPRPPESASCPSTTRWWLAKVTATLDYLSGGRFALGVGIGWLEEEFVAMGIPWEHRAKTHAVNISRRCASLWGEDPSSYSGEYVNFKNVRSNPKPGAGRQAAGDFWRGKCSRIEAAWLSTATDGAASISPPTKPRLKSARIEELLKANGRKRSDIEIAVSPYSKAITKDDLKRYRDAGADEVVLINLRPPRAEGENLADLEKNSARMG